MSDATDAIRAAWLALDDASNPLAALQRMSLEMAAVGNTSLEEALADVKAPAQAELDLHLTGERVAGHETDARPFGQFITRTAAAVQELAKALSGRERYGTNLRVLAPSPGSVRVVLRAPEPTHTAQTIPGDTDGDSLDSLAIRQFAGILEHSEVDDDQSSPLVASVRALPVPARLAVRQVARVVAEAGWDLDGHLRQRGRSTAVVRLSHSGAARIVTATEATEVVEERGVMSGVIDGQRRSRNSMWFQPDSGRSFAAVVADTQLLDRVAELAAIPDGRVQARFAIFVSHGDGEGRYTQRSYRLEAIDPIAATQGELTATDSPG